MKPFSFFKWAILDVNNWNLIAIEHNNLHKEIQRLNQLLLFFKLGNDIKDIFDKIVNSYHLELGQQEMILNLRAQGYL